MEQYNALRAGPVATAHLQHVMLDVEQLQRLRHEAGPPCVFLLEADDLERLAVVTKDDLITLRGTKDKRRQLSYYFRKHPGVTGLHAVYKHAGLVERGVRDLLRCERLSPGTVCLLGLKKELFNELGKRAVPAAPPQPIGTMPGYDDDALRELLDHHSAFPVPADRQEKFDRISMRYIGSSQRIERVRRLIWLAAQSRHPVLIQGESGTGKEIVARQIRECSPHPYKQFIALNCGAIPTELLESELFGCVKGAFNDAITRDGMVAAAEDGVLFLDEIGDLLPQHQAKILRLIENKEYNKVGSNRVLTSNARIIAATHRDLASLVRLGRFREDLYYRLFTIRIRTPSLREHPEDIPKLGRHLWHKINREDGHEGTELPSDVLGELSKYSWPGNARELRATLVNIAMMAVGKPVELSLVQGVMRDRYALNPFSIVPGTFLSLATSG